jgi:hypothetical protein
MTVIVEPDSAAAWAGLAGVVVGAMMTGGFAWLRIRHDERKEHQREVHRAADELLVAGNSLVVSLAAFKMAEPAGDALLNWTQVISGHIERVQAAAAVVLRGSPELGPAANAVQIAAVDYAREAGSPETTERVQARLREFALLAIPSKKRPPATQPGSGEGSV